MKNLNELFLCLGAGKNQIPLIHAAKNLGMGVIAVDQNPDAPGFAMTDCTITDYNIIESIHKPSRILHKLSGLGIVSDIRGAAARSFGRAGVSAALLAGRLELPGNDPRAVRRFQNKRVLKALLSENGFSVPKIYSWETPNSKQQFLEAPLPVICRPAVGHAKLGIQILHTQKERETFLSQEPIDRGTILAEEIIRGNEITVLGLIFKGQYSHVLTSDKIVSQKPPLFAETMHRFPSSLSENEEETVKEIMSRAVNFLGLRTGAVVAEFIKDDDGKFMLVEIAPEIGGEYIADLMAVHGAGIDLFSLFVLSSTGHSKSEAEIHIQKNGRGRSDGRASGKRAIIIRFLMPKDGIVSEIEAPPFQSKNSELLFSRQLKSAGDRLSRARGNLDRPYVFVLCGESEKLKEVEEDAENYAGEIKIGYRH